MQVMVHHMGAADQLIDQVRVFVEIDPLSGSAPGNPSPVFLFDGTEGTKQEEGIPLIKAVIGMDLVSRGVRHPEESPAVRVEIDQEPDVLHLARGNGRLHVLAKLEPFQKIHKH